MVDVRVVIGIVEHIGDLAAQVDTAGGEVPHKALRLQRIDLEEGMGGNDKG